MKILFLTNLLPYPLNNGGKIKSYNTINILSKTNKVDLFCFYEEDSELSYISNIKEICNDVKVVKKKITTSKNKNYMLSLAIKNLISKTPLVAYKFKDKKLNVLIEEALKSENYDLVIIDHLQLAVYLPKIKKYCNNIILDQHNCESKIIYRKQQLEKNIIKKLYLKYEYNRLKKFESNTMDAVKKIIVLSDEDKLEMIRINKKINKDKFINIPIPIQIDYEKEIRSKNGNHIRILFLGTMSWYPNSQGIEWFVKEVIPYINMKNIKYELSIVGKDPDKNLIDLCKDNKNIIITGFVEDINKYIELCDVMIVPLFIGSGMRVKILESMGKCLPVISTTIGAEGIEAIDGKHILIANNKEEFYEKLLYINDKEIYVDLQKNGKELFEKKYSVDYLGKKFNKLMRELE